MADYMLLIIKQRGVDGIHKAFQSYDVDGNGTISREEFKDWMTKHGHFLTRKQVASMIAAVDENGDGEIDYNEFLVIIISLTIHYCIY